MIEAAFSARLGGFDLEADFTAPGRGVTALFGPSGCGKTTVLRCVAGLMRAPKGRLSVNGESWQEGRRFRPVHRRPLGYVFQEASLFPHLSVKANLMFGARRAARFRDRREAAAALEEVSALLGVDRLMGRDVAKLSGGERQRVAIGRALLSRPKILLMDEPLSALDRMSKEEILPYLEKLHDRLSIPVLYVSHDASEVERLADTVVAMKGGRVQAVLPTAEALTDPRLPFGRAPDAAAVLTGVVRRVDREYGLSEVAVEGGSLLIPGDLGPQGARRRLRATASDVSLGREAPRDTSILNALPARVLGADAADGATVTVRLALGESGGGAALLSRISRLSWDRLALAEGELVYARIKAAALGGPLTGGEPTE